MHAKYYVGGLRRQLTELRDSMEMVYSKYRLGDKTILVENTINYLII